MESANPDRRWFALRWGAGVQAERGLLPARVEELAGGGVGAWCEDSAGWVIAGSFASHDIGLGREPFEAVSALCGDDWFELLVEDG